MKIPPKRFLRRPPWVLALVSSVAVGQVGCAPEAGSTQTTASALTTPTVRTGSTPTRADACSGSRQIGLNPRPYQACPAARDYRWRSVNLFPNSNSAELNAYCTYDWTDHTKPPRLDRLPRAGHPSPADWLESDCEVLALYGHPYAARNAQRLETAFLDQMETVVPPPTMTGPTKVVVVDTAVNGPFPAGAGGRMDHGQGMSTIIRKLACPAGLPCLATVTTQLSMPLIKAPNGMRIDTVNGGSLGRPSDVAAAIHRGLHYALANPGSNRIIINLSLGWESRWGGSVGLGGWSALAPPIRMVYSAITEAYCAGAIIIGASGNAGGGPDPDPGPVFPAAWERIDAPDAARCAGFGGGPPPSGTASYMPLVYAAGGVDGADEPLANERPNGRPRLLAPSSHVTVLDGGYVSEPYTGSSVSAAVASAMASIVWTYQPNLSPAEVMELVYDASVDLSLPVHLCLGQTCSDTAKRMSMCRTIESACQPPGCPGVVACGPPNPGRDARVSGFDVSQPNPRVVTSTGSVAYTPPAPCTGTIYASDPTSLPNPCPYDQYYSGYTVRYTGPQPTTPLCPNCKLTDGLVYIGINDQLSGTVSDPVVTITHGSGDLTKIALENVGHLGANETAKVEIDSELASDAKKATIEFVHDGDFAGQDVLIIE